MEKSFKVVSYITGLIAVVFLVTHMTTSKFQQLKQQNGLISQEIVSIHTREKQLDCLAINIYREAGYEPFEGKVAVAQVTMNRVAHSGFPDDVCGVVYEKTRTVKTICQFSWYCDSTHRNRPLGPGYKESYEVAKKVLLEDFRLPSLTDAIFYHADYINPKWPYERITKVGTHIFYKPKERAVSYAKI